MRTLAYIFFIILLSCKSHEKNGITTNQILTKDTIIKDDESENFFSIQPKNLVPNDSVAIAIAEIIWRKLYGDKVLKFKPYKAELNDSVWVVMGTMKDFAPGPLPYMEIQKNDCKVLNVQLGK